MADENNKQPHSKDEMMRSLVTQISAYIEQYHGGSAELVSFEGDELKIRLGGACVGCPHSAATLRGWVEGTVHKYFPDVKVIGVDR
ncbi:MAG: NifU family protein [Chloroflexi bacterium]|nr:NifU family protein [Chloroflexota bacterium]